MDLLARQVLADHWGSSERPARVDIGVNKHTWLVGQRWLSCTYDHRAAAVERELQLYAYLGERARLPGAVAVPVPLASRNGPVVHAGRWVWWMTGHVAGRQPEPQVPADTLAVVRGLAGLHRWLQPVSPDLAVSQEDSLALLARATALLADPQHRGFLPADLGTLQEARELIADSLAAALHSPRQLIHGDPSYPNLRLSPGKQRRLVGALDWEECRLDFPLADLSTVGQTVVFRTGTPDPLADLAMIHATYGQLAGRRSPLGDLLLFMLLGKFESIAHHGARFLRGEAQQELVHSQATKIRVIVGLFRRVRAKGD